MTPICNHWPVIISTCFLQLSRDQTSLAFQPRPLFCHPMFLGRRPQGKAILCSFFPILVFATFHLFLQGNEACGGKWSGGYGGSSIVRQSLSASWGFASNCSTLWYNQRIKRLLSKPVFFILCSLSVTNWWIYWLGKRKIGWFINLKPNAHKTFFWSNFAFLLADLLGALLIAFLFWALNESGNWIDGQITFQWRRLLLSTARWQTDKFWQIFVTPICYNSSSSQLARCLPPPNFNLVISGHHLAVAH